MRFAALMAVCYHSSHPGNVGGKQNAEYTGRLDDELVPEFSMMSSEGLSRVQDPASAGANLALPSDAVVFKGKVGFPRKSKIEPLTVVLVESPTRGAYLCADLNHDGLFTRDEEFKFRPVPQRPNAIGDVVIRIAHNTGPFRYFPIRLRLFRDADQPGGPAEPGKRTIFYSFTAYATGTVKINPNAKPLRVWCEYHPESGQIDPLHGIVGMDLNGDGILDRPPSAERAVATGDEVVFAVRGKYLSIHRVDTATRIVTLRSHPESDYLRVELNVGTIFPNFEFADFEGKKHRLSDIKTKYVLLDFWGSWCGPCVDEFPTLKRAYEEFSPRGFQIIGIDAQEPSAKARECIMKNNLPWVEATSESTTELVEKRLSMSFFPTLILLDQERKIVSVSSGGPKLRGEDLLRTLDKLLPRS